MTQETPPPERPRPELSPGGLPRPQLFPAGQWKRFFLWFLIAVVVTVISSVAIPRLFPHRLLPAGTAAPAISLDTSDGGHVDLPSGAQGRPYVVEFFETSCPVCQQEVPVMCGLQKANPGVAFFGVDAARESAQQVQDFRRQRGSGCIAFPLLFDPTSDALRKYTVTVVPTVYLVDVHGRVAYTGTGAGGVDSLKTALAALPRG